MAGSVATFCVRIMQKILAQTSSVLSLATPLSEENSLVLEDSEGISVKIGGLKHRVLEPKGPRDIPLDPPWGVGGWGRTLGFRVKIGGPLGSGVGWGGGDSSGDMWVWFGSWSLLDLFRVLGEIL